VRSVSVALVLGLALVAAHTPAASKTVVSIQGREFLVNGRPTYEARSYDGMKVQGLLFNSRMVQGIFDDRNAETRARWNYPDGPWDPERNTREFVAAMPLWKAKGLLAFTINLQGGSPEGYSRSQPWSSSAFETDGALRPDATARLARILDRADELGMVAIVGFFYQGQERRMDDEQSVVRATDAATDWLVGQGYTHVLIEVANEADNAGFKYGGRDFPVTFNVQLARNVATGMNERDALLAALQVGKSEKRRDMSFRYVFAIKGANALISQFTDDDMGTNSGVNIRTHHFRFDYRITDKVIFENLFYIQNSLRRSGQYPNFFVPVGDFAPTTYRWQPQLVFEF